MAPVGARTWPAWILSAVLAAIAAGVVVTMRDLPAFEPDPAVPAWLVALLFGIAESAVFQVYVRGHAAAVVLRATPLLLGLFFLPPIQLVAAHLVAVGLLLVVRRPPSAAAAALTLAVAAFGTAAAAAVFRFLADEDPTSALDWWGAASAAALIVAAASILSRPRLPLTWDAQGTPAARIAAVIPTCLLAVVDASLGMTVVVHARNDPAELWLLAGPTAIAVLAYRAYASLRRRQAGLEFLHECARILDSPATGEAMLIALLQRTVEMFHAETAEILMDDGSGRPVRTVVGRSGALETLTPAPAECLTCVLALIPADSGGILLRAGDLVMPSDSPVDGGLTNGVLVRLHGDGRVIGALSVAGGTDGGPFGEHDLRLLEEVAGYLGAAIGTTKMIDELVASLADVTHLAALIGSSDDAIIAFAPDEVVTSWNAAAEALFGYGASEVVGGSVVRLVPPERAPDLAAAFARACEGAQVRGLHLDARRGDGTLVPISATVSPIVDADGRVTGISMIARDETERALNEHALRQSADRFRSVFEHSPVGMGVIDANLRWVRVNGALSRMLATTEVALVGRRFEQRVHRDDIGAAHGLVSRLLRGESAGSTVDVRLSGTGDGRVVVTAFTVRPLRDGDGTRQALCIVEDVTERRLAEERARETESRLHRAVLDLTAVREPTAVIRAALRAARDVIDAESAAAVLVEDGHDGAVPGSLIVDDGDAAGALGTRLRDEPGIAVHVAARGPVRLPHVGDGPDPGKVGFPSVAPLRSYLAVPVRFEDRVLATLHLGNRRDDVAFSDADVEAATVLAAQAAISLENARIHQRALALVQRLDEANTGLQQASEARSRLLASVSHELRTPLHSILLAAQLVRDSGLEQGGNRRVRGLGATIEGSGRHLLGLIDDFLDLSRIEVGAFELRPTPISLGPLLREVRREMAPLASEQGISLAIADVPGILVVADPLRLRQVLLNLLSNAVKFTPRGGRARLTVQLDDGILQLSVQDTGIGIAPEDLERAFLPFEQVSGTDTPGVGLGLAISRRIVELHGGTLTAVSAIGQGSTFTVTLPIGDALPADGRGGEPAAPGAVRRVPGADQPVAAGALPGLTVGRAGSRGAPRASVAAR